VARIPKTQAPKKAITHAEIEAVEFEIAVHDDVVNSVLVCEQNENLFAFYPTYSKFKFQKFVAAYNGTRFVPSVLAAKFKQFSCAEVVIAPPQQKTGVKVSKSNLLNPTYVRAKYSGLDHALLKNVVTSITFVDGLALEKDVLDCYNHLLEEKRASESPVKFDEGNERNDDDGSVDLDGIDFSKTNERV